MKGKKEKQLKIKHKMTRNLTGNERMKGSERERKRERGHTKTDRGLEREKCKLSFPFSFNLFYIFTHTFHSLIVPNHAETESSDWSNQKPKGGEEGHL